MTPSLRDRVRAGELTIGSWLSFGFTPVAEMMVQAGFDWLVVDMEHTGIGTFDAFQMIQVVDLAGGVPLVRVGHNHPLLIKRAMDAGAHGVVVPMVNTAQEAERAVQALRYPPRGSRGAGLSRAQAYGLGFEAHRAWAEDHALLIVQIEHVDAVRELEAILAVDGVDGFIVGPYDLAGSLGRPGDFAHPDVADALAEVARVAASGIRCPGFHVVHSDPALLARRIDEGYRFLAYGDDMVFLAEKLRDETDRIAVLRRTLPDAVSTGERGAIHAGGSVSV
jgi:2-keto-3-deoxy-L-rhamnonate aldolase RhmA